MAAGTGTDFAITIDGFSLSYTFGDNTYTNTVTEGYVISPNSGDFIMKKPNVNAYVKPDDSIICLAGVTNVGGADVTIYAPGTIDDGLTFSVLAGVAGATYSIGDPTFNYTNVDGYLDLESLSTIVSPIK